jgi:hypothetical protein
VEIMVCWKSMALAAALTVGGVAASPASAGGYYYYGGWSPGAAAAVGVLGGVAIGSAIAAGARPVAPAPVYVAPPPPEADCFVARRRVWVPGWGWELRRRTVCE